MSTMKRISAVVLIVMLALPALAIVPFVGAQEGPHVTVNITPYEGNPVIGEGHGKWTFLWGWTPVVVYHEGLYHMFFNGGGMDENYAVGYATSADGLAWEIHAENPVLQREGSAPTVTFFSVGGIIVEGESWVMYYGSRSPFSGGIGPIGRATASNPAGPWTRSEDPVLVKGGPGEWDSSGVFPSGVVAAEEGYVLYYCGGHIISEENIMIGMATSPDGITWTKYDDPATTEAPYAESDPILFPGLEGWDSKGLIQVAVRQTGEGWEMFFSEKVSSEEKPAATYRIGYASSDDGIHWVKSGDFPVLSGEDDPAARSLKHVLAGSVLVTDSTYLLYYDYHPRQGGIGVATGTVTHE